MDSLVSYAGRDFPNTVPSVFPNPSSTSVDTGNVNRMKMRVDNDAKICFSYFILF